MKRETIRQAVIKIIEDRTGSPLSMDVYAFRAPELIQILEACWSQAELAGKMEILKEQSEHMGALNNDEDTEQDDSEGGCAEDSGVDGKGVPDAFTGGSVGLPDKRGRGDN